MSIVKNIYIQKNDFVLDISELEISDEGITLLQGPSGAGKTLFIHALIGFEPSQKALVWDLKGVDLAQKNIPDRRLGVVFQTLELFSHMTVQENILFHARARNISEKESLTKLQLLAKMANLEGKLNQTVATLSGGEKQRVAILRAVIGNPQILILDEPFSSLDEELKNSLRVFLKELVLKEKIPCLLVSHDPIDVKIANKVIKINQGKIISK